MFLRKLLLSTAPIALLLFVGCGQSPHNKDSRGPTGNRRNADSPQVWNFIQRQKITCDDKFLCQESVAKLVVIDSQTIRYCTAALVGTDTLVTSASCLTRSLKIPGLDCSENIFAIFPQTNIQIQQIFKCDQILSADINENLDKALWRSDLAFIKLQEAPARRVFEISREGLAERSNYKVWKGNYLSDTDANLTVSDCRPVFKSYMNPFAINEKSPFMPVENCHFTEGNTGGIVLNDRDEVAGVLSSNLDLKIKEFVISSGWLKEPLKNLTHVTNMSCARLPFARQTEVEDKSCHEILDQAHLDRMRSELLRSKGIHAENIRNIEAQMRNMPMKYFNWNFTFLPGTSGETYEMHMSEPKCFFDIRDWITEFRNWGRIRSYGYKKMNFPHIRLKPGLSGNLKSKSLVDELGDKEYVIEFNPRGAWGLGKTYVKITAELFGAEKKFRYEDITADCN